MNHEQDEIARLRADRARLDWYEKNHRRLEAVIYLAAHLGPRGETIWVDKSDRERLPYHTSLRDAIDRARDKEQSPAV
jgi:hypothetical protein